jgi:hypothetical protein
MYCQNCQQSTLFDDSRNQNELKCIKPESTSQYRQQYVKDFDPQPSSQSILTYESLFSSSGLSSPSRMTMTSLLSPSTNNFPKESVSRTASPSQIPLEHHGSILMRAYSKQVHPQ